jgi:hypothetical protein
MNYEELLLLFCMCLVVPGAVAIAPGTMTRSSFARVTFQVYSVGVGLFGFLHFTSRATAQLRLCRIADDINSVLGTCLVGRDI